MSQDDVTTLNIGRSRKRKQKPVTVVDKKAEAIAKEIQGFKDKCKILYKRNFPSFFDGNGDLYWKEPSLS